MRQLLRFSAETAGGQGSTRECVVVEREKGQSMTRERIAMWIVLGLIALTALFNNYLLHHIEDQIDGLQTEQQR